MAIIKKAVLGTEKARRMIELENTLVFEVDKNAKKADIKNEFERIYKVKSLRVNTQRNLDKKLAYVKLSPEAKAIDIATDLGLI